MRKDVREVLYLWQQQFLESIGMPRVIVGYALGVLLAVVPTVQYMIYAGNRSVQLCESFILTLTNPINEFIIFVGLLLILSDSPFITCRSAMMLYRVSKKKWERSMVLYMLSHTLIYYGIIFGTTMLISVKNSYTANVWSRVMNRMVNVESLTAASQFGISVPKEYLLRGFSPVQGMVSSFCLLCLCGMFFALILYFINLKWNPLVGNIIVLLLQLVGVSVCRNYILWIPDKFMPICLTNIDLMSFMGISVPYALTYFCIAIIILAFGVRKRVQKADVQIIAGE